MNQKRTIMGACDYSIETLRTIKRKMADPSDPNNAINWAIGGIVCTLTSNLLGICEQVFSDAAKSGETTAKEDMQRIQTQFNEFIERMLNHE